MQTLVSVVTLRERKMLSALIAAGTEVPTSSVIGEPRAGVQGAPTLLMSSQRNRISPYRSPQGVENREVDNGDADMGVRKEANAAL